MKPADPPQSQKWALYRSDLGGYMHRRILRTPWFNLRLHHILESDSGRDFHDHPFDFTSVILSGGYVEHRPGCKCFPSVAGSPPLAPCALYGPGSVVSRKAEDFHRLELVNGPARTFVIAGPYRRPWGFLLPDGSWQHYQEYHRSYYHQEVEP